MSMTMFVKVFPEFGEAETRTLTTFNHPDLPPDRYAFAESYCDERGCDCRRVTFNVIAMEGKRHVATIAHALDDSTPRYDLPRTFLDPMNPQTELSPALLDQAHPNDPAGRQLPGAPAAPLPHVQRGRGRPAAPGARCAGG